MEENREELNLQSWAYRHCGNNVFYYKPLLGHAVTVARFIILTRQEERWLKAYLNRKNSSTFMCAFNSAKSAGYKCKNDVMLGFAGIETLHKCRPLIDEWFDA